MIRTALLVSAVVVLYTAASTISYNDAVLMHKHCVDMAELGAWPSSVC